MKLLAYMKALQKILEEEGGDIDVVYQSMRHTFKTDPPVVKKTTNDKYVVLVNP